MAPTFGEFGKALLKKHKKTGRSQINSNKATLDQSQGHLCTFCFQDQGEEETKSPEPQEANQRHTW